MDTGLAALIASVISNSVFYILFREQLKKADERQIEADKRWQDVVNDARTERNKLMEIIIANAKEATKTRKTPDEQLRLNEAFRSQKPPSEPIPPPGGKHPPLEY